MDKLREFLKTPAGMVCGVVLALGALAAAFFAVRGALGAGEAADYSRQRVYICSETGKSFRIELKAGIVEPVKSPHSGKNTGYPAESCYWARDGTIKSEPTYVFVKEYAGIREPSFCPECGRLVVRRNPAPVAGKPPPTEAEYRSRRSVEE